MTSIPSFKLSMLSRNTADAVAPMRDAGPLVTVKIPIIGKAHFPTTYDLVVAMLKDDGNYRQRSRDGHVAGLRWWMPRSIRVLSRNMLTMDGEEHRRLRAMVDAAFQRRNIVGREPHITEIADALIDGMPANVPVDLVAGFASRLPLAVICDLLGLPKRDWPQFIKLANRFTSAGSIGGLLTALPAISALMRYLDRFIGKIAKSGGNGLVAELVHDLNPGDPASREELVAMAFLLLVAGHQTTTHLISGAILALLTNGRKKQEFITNPDGHGIAVEEFLRFVSPVQLTKPRIAARDVTVAGHELPAGTMFMPFLAAANRDPQIFDRPDELDISRKPNRHIAFGTGVHFCLGHQLARIEARVALERLFTRYPGLQLAVDPDAIEYHSRTGLRAMKALPVILDPAR